MYDIKWDIIKFTVLSIPLYIINGGHSVICVLWLLILPYHIWCNAQEKKEREEAYRRSQEHIKEEKAVHRQNVLKIYLKYMLQGDEYLIPEEDRELVRKRAEEYRAEKARIAERNKGSIGTPLDTLKAVSERNTNSSSSSSKNTNS